jgi:hypothetical protein
MKLMRPFLLGQAKYVPLAFLLSRLTPNFLLYFLVGGRPFSDKLVPARCVVPFRKYLPDLIVKSVDGPHGILQAQPEKCAEIIMEFVRNLSKSRNAKLELRTE